MKKRILKKFIFEMFGFPVILTNVPLKMVRGEYIPDIKYNKLEKAVLLHLCHKKTPLTGNEIRCIRQHFSLTTNDFGYIFGYSHSAVLKWEKQGDRIARIAPTTEFYLRVYLLDYIQKDKSDFKSLYNEIHIPDLAEYLKKPKKLEYSPLSIDIYKESLSAA